MNINKISLVQLSQQVSQASKKIQDYLESQDLEDLGFAEDAPKRFPDAPQDILEARISLLDATDMLRDLALGPVEQLKSRNLAIFDIICLNWIHHFQIARHVPINGQISYNDLASAAGVEVAHLRRILRFSMLFRLFRETTNDQVSHSASSRVLATEDGVASSVTMICEEMLPVGPKLVEAHESYGSSTKNFHSAWNVYNKVDGEPRYSWWEKNAFERTTVFSSMMAEAWKSPDRDIRYLINGYDWSSLPSGSVVVDVGGSTGQLSVGLATTFNQLKFVVQDFQSNIERGEKMLPNELKDRVAFMAHDFFTPQPVKEADIYLLHWVLLDHLEHNAIQILRGIIQSMGPKSKIIVRDGILPEPGTCAVADESRIRITDLICMTMSNAGMRDLNQWKLLFQKADERLTLESLYAPKGSTANVMKLGLVN